MTFAGLSAVQMATLFAALGGGMALLYLLKLRRRRVRVPFGPLWARVVKEQRSTTLFSSLKRLFSFLVQLAILACFVLALGDPQLGGLGCSMDKAPPAPERHTLILLDASASMGSKDQDTPRIDKARAKAVQVIDNIVMNPNHRAMIVQLDQRLTPLSLWTTSRDELLEALDRYAPEGALDTPTGLKEAMGQLRSMVQGRSLARTVLISDQAFDELAPADLEALQLSTINVGAPAANIGIEAFNVRPAIDDSLAYSIFYGVRNESDEPIKAQLTLYANAEGLGRDDFMAAEHLISSHSLELGPRARTTGILEDVHFPGSRIMALVEVSGPDVRDVLDADNVAFALVPERRKLKAQLIGQGNLFLEASLFVRENVDFDVVEKAAFSGPLGYDITIVDGLDVDMSGPGSYFVLNPQPGSMFEIEGSIEEPSIGKVRKGHPLIRKLKLVDLNILEASRIKRQKGDVVVVAATDGAPLIFTREDRAGGRRFVVFAFDIRRSLLPFNYVFPLMVVNVFNHFFEEDAALLTPRRAGLELSIPFALAGKNVGVRGPRRANDILARRIADRVHLFTDRIGIYELGTDQSQDVHALAINLMSPSESRLDSRGDYPAWEPEPVLKRVENPWFENLWRLLILGALLIFTIEWFTYHRRLTV